MKREKIRKIKNKFKYVINKVLSFRVSEIQAFYFFIFKKEVLKFGSHANIVAEYTMKITDVTRSLPKERR